jgi:hypothetical protein
MPKGIPVATFAVGEAGAANAALFAIAVLAGDSPALARKLSAFRSRQRARVRAMKLPTVKKKTAEKKAVTKKTATKTAVAKKTIVKKAATKKVASRK